MEGAQGQSKPLTVGKMPYGDRSVAWHRYHQADHWFGAFATRCPVGVAIQGRKLHHFTGISIEIIVLFDARFTRPENAGNELTIGARFGHGDGAQFDAFAVTGMVERMALEGTALITYEMLIGGTYGETLDDGGVAVDLSKYFRNCQLSDQNIHRHFLEGVCSLMAIFIQ
ncbi:hypothetical protein ACFPL7_23665 [Dongia soli]|uniref:Uncharacterized protein n=1 Tax=Dongia soli TaxID=600628 RepID=A0ABU5EG14_9PROT|nr:hypothetical protein [Dongia soli]MDY0885301.1 hypothetical protein [Dongia soli]